MVCMPRLKIFRKTLEQDRTAAALEVAVEANLASRKEEA